MSCLNVEPKVIYTESPASRALLLKQPPQTEEMKFNREAGNSLCVAALGRSLVRDPLPHLSITLRSTHSTSNGQHAACHKTWVISLVDKTMIPCLQIS